jgi:hypothetical protein
VKLPFSLTMAFLPIDLSGSHVATAPPFPSELHFSIGNGEYQKL